MKESKSIKVVVGLAPACRILRCVLSGKHVRVASIVAFRSATVLFFSLRESSVKKLRLIVVWIERRSAIEPGNFIGATDLEDVLQGGMSFRRGMFWGLA